MATKLATAGTAFLGIAKTIFPGLIVSIIGGSFAFIVFNNPDKIRGKATLRAWESLKQYERLYTENTDHISCGDYVIRFDRFKIDMIHQIQLIIENLKNIQDKETNVDNLMLAVINMKIDSYNEMKKLTETHMDSLLSLYHTSDFSEAAIMNRMDRLKRFYGDYMEESAYIKERDSASITRMLKELSNTYSLNFEEDKFLPDSAGLFKKVIGKWNLGLLPFSFELKADGTGYWKMLKDSLQCTWKLVADTIKVNFINDSHMNLEIKRLYPDILVLNDTGDDHDNIVVACRNRNPN